MARTKNKRTRKPSTRLLLAGAVALVLIGALAYWKFGSSNNNPSTSQTTPETQKYVNLNPPTAQEKSQADSHKDDLANNANNPSAPAPVTPSGKKQVTPIITSADKSSINAYVSGVFEDGGTCTATITNTGTSQVVTKTSEGFKNVSYTGCAPMGVNLANGSWSVVVSYSSAAAEGKSQPKTVEVK